jgi:TonB family protein
MKTVFLLLLSLAVSGCKDDKEVISPQTNLMLNRSEYLVSVDKTPVPEGGIEAIQNKIVYPAEAKEKGIEGKVHVLMFIDEMGIVTSAEVIKGVHHLLDRAALDAVKDVKFTPGIIKGEAVKTQVAIPIVFKLNGDSKKGKSELKNEGGYFFEADEFPQIIGGPAALIEKIVYPKEEREKGIQGDVVVAVYINEKGEVEKAEIEKSLNENFDNAALNAVKEVKYTPGKIKEKNVKMKISIPIKFKLM